jgi:hypothetical protein
MHLMARPLCGKGYSHDGECGFGAEQSLDICLLWHALDLIETSETFPAAGDRAGDKLLLAFLLSRCVLEESSDQSESLHLSAVSDRPHAGETHFRRGARCASSPREGRDGR